MAEHLRNVTAFYINVDRAVQRRENIERHVDPLVSQLIRVPAVNKMDLSEEEVDLFTSGCRSTETTFSLMGFEVKNQWSSRDWYRGTLAVLFSHLKAIETAVDHCVDNAEESFLILEDDAVPRVDLLTATPEPHDADVVMWGGCKMNGAYAPDHRAYRDWTEGNPWRMLPTTFAGVKGRHLAHAYEMKVDVARQFVSVVRANPHAFDWAWWFGLMNLRVAVPQIETFYQDLEGGSYRIESGGRMKARLAKTLETEQLI